MGHTICRVLSNAFNADERLIFRGCRDWDVFEFEVGFVVGDVGYEGFASSHCYEFLMSMILISKKSNEKLALLGLICLRTNGVWSVD